MSYISELQAYELWKEMPGNDWTALRHLIENEYLSEIDYNLQHELDLIVKNLELEDLPFPNTYKELREVLNENL
jgi:hypothetical protein